MRFLQRSGVNIEPARFYSQLPTVDDIEGSFEYEERYAERGPYKSLFDIEHLGAELAEFSKFSRSFTPGLDKKAPGEYFWKNPAFSYSDAMTYWAALNRYKPRRVVEVGAGYSTLIARRALLEGVIEELVLIDPYPMEWMKQEVPEAELIVRTAQSFDPPEFADFFSDGDLLFIDSTHTVKLGSDCLAIYLLLLPAIDAQIEVHVHDIYLPFGFPKAKAHLRQHWTEQHLLAAYLLDNPLTTINYGSVANQAFHPTGMLDLMHGQFQPGGASLWFSKSGRETVRSS